MPGPRPLTEDEQESLLHSSLARIRTGGEEVHDPSAAVSGGQGQSLEEMSTQLYIRLLTRGLSQPPRELNGKVNGDIDMAAVRDSGEERREQEDGAKVKVDEALPNGVEDRIYQDELRQKLCDYITSDFPARYVPHSMPPDEFLVNPFFLQGAPCDKVDERRMVQ